jgi:hypothetical protein
MATKPSGLTLGGILLSFSTQTAKPTSKQMVKTNTFPICFPKMFPQLNRSLSKTNGENKHISDLFSKNVSTAKPQPKPKAAV